MDMDERFWNATSEEIKQGYLYDGRLQSYCCLLCGEQFEDGEVFKLPGSDRFFNAAKYAGYHVQSAHGSMLEYLLSLDKKATGLTVVQKQLVSDFAQGLSDREIVQRTGGSASTIRNHRFVLKEKAKQAKLLLAVMELMESCVDNIPKFMPVHRTATVMDERFAITEEEYKGVLRQYLPDGLDGPLASIPSKEKRKVALLRHMASYFKLGERYTEGEVNERLIRFSDDQYVTLRRYLVEYGFLDREVDGSAYWIPIIGKDGSKVKEREKVQAETTAIGSNGNEQKSRNKPDKAARKAMTAEYQERVRAMGVYGIKNNMNGRMYIGASTNMDGLWSKEQFILGLGSHMNKKLQQEWKQFGREAFTYLILETVKTEEDIRYDYRDVYDTEGNELASVARDYKRKVERLKEEWLEKLKPYGEQGYH
ncbi:DUF2087 domain-containing protein [Paenibacillus sp. 1011MAR3C5]|uniref:DUF2087 domain-containing protein n=1 Tax=Paenibacillus sp. 1011MAR3C5 TaxID=1675787 RepID=UPI000E6B5D6E|nr:DUF2087 domain-containing protein [Paenibacillus sp. 1011MAR3C5]RJE88840.1 DUF2087 domain-containing protein [Paenibacillus sp. 1011MAR3C5]